MLGVHFFEPLCPCKDEMSIKKVFHFWPSEMAASVHCQYDPSRLDWQHMLAAISNGQKRKFFKISFCPQMGIEVQKSALQTLFHFARVRVASQPHVSENFRTLMVEPFVRKCCVFRLVRIPTWNEESGQAQGRQPFS